ncbi:MAG: hypothetical protein L0Y80_13000 [Ignavibacteriae bacterium]|nr:hypothetical protein [Ignavibacteriota bacterium]
MKLLTVLFTIFLCTSIAIAQDTTAAKIDTVLLNQKAMMELQQKMYDETQYIPPLANKTMGIELNLARLLASSADNDFTLAGTFSLFAVTRRGEIAFPFFYQKSTSTVQNGFDNTEYKFPLTLVNFDATYRHFLGKYQDGFYFSTGVRYTYIKGVEGTDFFFFSSGSEVESSMHRFGAYFGAGYRYFSESGFYWGISVIYGRYFGDWKGYHDVLFDDQKVLIDMELLKFGFAF